MKTNPFKKFNIIIVIYLHNNSKISIEFLIAPIGNNNV